MSYIKLYDRVKELSNTQGTFNFELEGAVEGFSAFSDVYSNGDHLFYAITDGTNYEVGSGTFVDGGEQLDQIVRFPLRTSNSNNIVDFPQGIKEIYATYPATNAVYHNSGVADLQTPSMGGVTFWVSENIIGYDNDVVWDDTYKRLGIRNQLPEYGIDVGGYGPESSIKASGFLVGNSGIRFFPASNGDPSYEGGSQFVHYEPNLILDENTKTIVGYSGDVSQHLYFKEQNKGFVLAGPPSGCGGGCSPAKPFFRPLTLEDIPDLNSIYATDIELLNVSGILSNYTTQVSGLLSASDSTLSGILDNKIDTVSGVISNELLDVSGILRTHTNITSGVLYNYTTEVSGVLSNYINEVSGVTSNYSAELSGVLSNYTYEVSGVLDNYIDNVSGSLYEVSGIFRNELDNLTSNTDNLILIQAVSGMVLSSGSLLESKINQVSGVLRNDVEGLSGLLYSASGHLFDDIQTVSGLLYEASGHLFDDIEAVSGLLYEASGYLFDDIEAVSGLLYEASGYLFDDIEAVSGLLYEASGYLFDDIEAVSGLLYEASGYLSSDIESVSGSIGLSDKLLVDLTGTNNTAEIINNDVNEPTHLRITNNNGAGSRLLLTSSSTTGGNTWGNISLDDGAYRIFNYTADYIVNVTGINTGTNEIILDSGYAWKNFLPLKLIDEYVSGTFLNNGDPEGIKIVNQFPTSGHILTLESAPTSTTLPASVTIMNSSRNGISISTDSRVGIDLDPQSLTAKLDLRGDSIRIRHSGTVPTSTSNGYEGEIRWDANYLYLCTSNNSWKRVALDGTPWS